MTVEHSGFHFKELAYLESYFEDIPEKEGIYSWVYWPRFDPYNSSENAINSCIKEFTTTNLTTIERTEKFKFRVEVGESGFPQNGNLFGLNEDKSAALWRFVSEKKNRSAFANFFKYICFSRPFYIGKADNLRMRLVQHFRYQTKLRSLIDDNHISSNKIWVGFSGIELSQESGLNIIFEEILQRTLKPGLSLKPN